MHANSCENAKKSKSSFTLWSSWIAIAKATTGALVGRGKENFLLQNRREMQDAFGSSQPPFRIWRPTSSCSASSSSDYFIHLGRHGSPPHIPAKEAALPDQIPDYGGVFRASVLEEEAAQKYLPTRGARERGISCIYTVRGPPRPRVKLPISPVEDDDPMIGGAAEVVANRADPTDRPIEVDEM